MIFADTNWLLAVLGVGADTEDDRRRRALAARVMGRIREPLRLSRLVAYELEGVLRRSARTADPPALVQFRTAAGELFDVVEPDWPLLLEKGDALQRRFCPRTRLGALDSLHLAAAQLMGATHFFSFDRNSDLRACALALKLRLQPESAPGERQKARGL